MVRSGLLNGGGEWCAHRKMRAQRIVSIIIIIVIVIILIVTTSAVAVLVLVVETDNVAVVGHSWPYETIKTCANQPYIYIYTIYTLYLLFHLRTPRNLVIYLNVCADIRKQKHTHVHIARTHLYRRHLPPPRD